MFFRSSKTIQRQIELVEEMEADPEKQKKDFAHDWNRRPLFQLR